MASHVPEKRFTHDAVKQIRAIFRRVAEEICQDFACQSTMEGFVDEPGDASGQRVCLTGRLSIGREGMGEVEQIAHEIAKILLRRGLFKTISPLR